MSAQIESSAAGRLYRTYCNVVRIELGDSVADGLPGFAALPEQGAAWYAVAAAIPLASKPLEPLASLEYKIEDEIRPMIIGAAVGDPGGEVSGEVYKTNDPTTLTIRPMVAGDLAAGSQHPLGSSAEDDERIAAVLGIDVVLYLDRLSMADAQAAKHLVYSAAGEDAWVVLRRAFALAGGEPIEGDAVAWAAVAWKALSTEQGNSDLVVCRTPGVGTLQVGPLTTRHWQRHNDVADAQGEWPGRLAVVAAATGKDLEVIKSLRPEDMIRLWYSVLALKKKSEATSTLRYVAALSSQSTAGPTETSQTSPSSDS